MSNIYIQEPPTSGKVLLKTTVGDIDIELWSRECPLACRNFVQLCMEGYYNGTVFHRLVKGFIVQGGDPNGDGTGGESIYGHTFRDEFHSRLRFVRRGLVAMANSGKHDNGSQFFFTLGPTQELQNVHTLFGKVAGDTIYNMLRLEEGEVYENERPHFPAKILKTEVLHNPFSDIIPRALKSKKSEGKEMKKKEKGVKNYGLLSFGDEAEEEEQETNEYVQKSAFSGKSKSSHDVLDDPKLSKQAIDVKPGGSKAKAQAASGSESEQEDRGTSSRDKKQIEQDAQAIRDKLKKSRLELRLCRLSLNNNLISFQKKKNRKLLHRPRKSHPRIPIPTLGWKVSAKRLSSSKRPKSGTKSANSRRTTNRTSAKIVPS